MSGRAVEAAGDVDVLLLDKTGTITLGNRQATAFIPADGVDDGGTGRRGPARLAGRRDARRPQHRGAGQGAVRPARARHRTSSARQLHAVHRPDAHERRGPRRARDPQGRRRRHRGATSAARAARSRRGRGPRVDGIAKEGGTPLVVADGAQGPGRHPPQGHRQGRHQGALRRAAAHGHQDGDDHRRQPADRRRHRRRGRRGRLPGPGHARGQAASSSASTRPAGTWWP